MMDIGTICIPMAFILLFALLLWQIIYARGRWTTKLFLIIVIPLFGISVWRSLDSYLGWPALSGPSHKFQVIYIGVKEPNLRTGDEGAIYILAKSIQSQASENISFIFEFHPHPDEPRLFKIPYSRSMHERAERVMEMLKKGKSVIGERDGGFSGNGAKSEEESNDKSQKLFGGDAYKYGKEQQFNFYELPAPKLPSKTSHER